MTVYADVLICINLIIDYFIISLTSKLLKTDCSFGRQILGAVAGAVCSLFILLPYNGIITAFLIVLFTSVSVVLVAYGIGGIAIFLRRVSCFYVISFAFSGAMFAVWYFVKPEGLLVRNGIVYYNLSSMVLVISAIFTYCLILLISRFLKRGSVTTCKLRIDTYSSSVELTALVDSGNRLKEPFSEKPVLLLDPKYEYILDGTDFPARVIPFNTVSGEGTILGVRPKAVYLLENKGREKLDVYVAISPKALGEFGAIVSTDAI